MSKTIYSTPEFQLRRIAKEVDAGLGVVKLDSEWIKLAAKVIERWRAVCERLTVHAENCGFWDGDECDCGFERHWDRV